MNKRTLYLKTADYIEKHPELYRFGNISVPDCGSEGCYIGLMGMIACRRKGEIIDKTSRDLLGMEHGKFYDELRRVSKEGLVSMNAVGAAEDLRALAAEEPHEDTTDASDYSFNDLMDLLQTNSLEPVE